MQQKRVEPGTQETESRVQTLQTMNKKMGTQLHQYMKRAEQLEARLSTYEQNAPAPASG